MTRRLGIVSRVSSVSKTLDQRNGVDTPQRELDREVGRDQLGPRTVSRKGENLTQAGGRVWLFDDFAVYPANSLLNGLVPAAYDGNANDIRSLWRIVAPVTGGVPDHELQVNPDVNEQNVLTVSAGVTSALEQQDFDISGAGGAVTGNPNDVVVELDGVAFNFDISSLGATPAAADVMDYLAAQSYTGWTVSQPGGAGTALRFQATTYGDKTGSFSFTDNTTGTLAATPSENQTGADGSGDVAVELGGETWNVPVGAADITPALVAAALAAFSYTGGTYEWTASAVGDDVTFSAVTEGDIPDTYSFGAGTATGPAGAFAGPTQGVSAAGAVREIGAAAEYIYVGGQLEGRTAQQKHTVEGEYAGNVVDRGIGVAFRVIDDLNYMAARLQEDVLLLAEIVAGAANPLQSIAFTPAAGERVRIIVQDKGDTINVAAYNLTTPADVSLPETLETAVDDLFVGKANGDAGVYVQSDGDATDLTVVKLVKSEEI